MWLYISSFIRFESSVFWNMNTARMSNCWLLRILLLFSAILNTMFSQGCRLQYSRDTLLAINNGHRCVALDTGIHDVISRLHLHRRGCRAGDHRRRRDIAAQMVTSSVNTAVSAARQRRRQGIPWESPGKHVRQRAEAVQTLTSSVDPGDSAQPRAIPVIVNDRRSIQRATLYEGRSQKRQPVRMEVRRSSLLPFVKGNGGTSYGITSFPTLYVLNAASIAKPHAIQHLSADLISYNVHIAVITETFKKEARRPPCCYHRLFIIQERSLWS